MSPIIRQVLIILILIAIVLGLAGHRPVGLLASLPTPVVDLAETKAPPTPAVASQSTATESPLPTRTLSLAEASPAPPPILDAAVPMFPPIGPTLINHGDRSVPQVALTFDACQTGSRPTGYDEAIIRILTDYGTPATLFLGGLWVRWHPAQTRELAANPLFELGNHSWSHADFTRLNPEEMSIEILRTQDIVYRLTGRQPTLFRFPYDSYTDKALELVGQHGLYTVRWDVATGDPDPYITTRAIIDVVTTEAKNGSIVIMHMNTLGRHTAEALPAVIRRLRAQGYSFVTVSQLVGLSPLPTSLAPDDERP